MKMLVAASALALAAVASQASAAPLYTPTTGWYQGSYTCTIASAPKLKLFMTLNGRFARAAVREYPYYGQTQYTRLIRISSPSFTNVTFRGLNAFLSLRRSSPGVLTGSGRIGTTLMLLTCAKS